MTKRQVFIGAGSVVLAVAAFLSTNANKKFSGTGTAFFSIGGAIKTLFKIESVAGNRLTQVKGSNKTAFFATTKNSGRTLFAAKTALGNHLTATLFYKP